MTISEWFYELDGKVENVDGRVLVSLKGCGVGGNPNNLEELMKKTIALYFRLTHLEAATNA